MIGDRELMTLHEVAVLLNVPNKYVERLLRDGHIPVRGAGTEVRVRAVSVAANAWTLNVMLRNHV